MVSDQDELQEKFPAVDGSVIAAILLDLNSKEESIPILTELNNEALKLGVLEKKLSLGLEDIVLTEDNVSNINNDTNIDKDINKNNSVADETYSDDPLIFLQKAFPEVELEDLKRVLDKCKGNIELSVDEVLTREFILEDENLSAMQYKNKDCLNNLLPHKKNRISYKNLENENFFALSSVAKSKKKKDKLSTNSNNSNNKNNNNHFSVGISDDYLRWSDKSGKIKNLSNFLSLKKGVLESFLNFSNGDIYEAVSIIFSLGEDSGIKNIKDNKDNFSNESNESNNENNDLLKNLYNKSSKKENEQMKIISDTNVGDYTDLKKQFYKTPNFFIKSIINQTAIPFEDKKNILLLCKDIDFELSLLNNIKHMRSEHARQHSNNQLKSYEDEFENKEIKDVYCLNQSLISKSTFELEKLEESLKLQRFELFNKATQLVRQSNTKKNMGGAASFYSEKAKEINFQLKEVTSALYYKNANKENSSSIDLHNIPSDIAIQISKEKLSVWWKKSKEQIANGVENVKYLQIITGKGIHSSDGKPKILPALVSYLKEDKWDYELCSGYVIVYGKMAS